MLGPIYRRVWCVLSKFVVCTLCTFFFFQVNALVVNCWHRRRHRGDEGVDPPTFIPALLVLLFLGGLSPASKKIFRLAALAIIIPPLSNLSQRPWLLMPPETILFLTECKALVHNMWHKTKCMINAEMKLKRNSFVCFFLGARTCERKLWNSFRLIWVSIDVSLKGKRDRNFS
jgi:hypothetical protein